MIQAYYISIRAVHNERHYHLQYSRSRRSAHTIKNHALNSQPKSIYQKGMRPTCAGKAKQRWSDDETSRLEEIVGRYGPQNWSGIAQFIPGRSAKQCRERWRTFCDPEFNKDTWSHADEQLLIDLHAVHGSKWARISPFLDNRSPVAIRNRWVSIQRRITFMKESKMRAEAKSAHQRQQAHIVHQRSAMQQTQPAIQQPAGTPQPVMQHAIQQQAMQQQHAIQQQVMRQQHLIQQQQQQLAIQQQALPLIADGGNQMADMFGPMHLRMSAASPAPTGQGPISIIPMGLDPFQQSYGHDMYKPPNWSQDEIELFKSVGF